MALTILLLFSLKIVGMVVFWAVVGLFDPSLLDIVTSQQDINFQKVATKSPAYWVLVVAILVPVVEEFIFRGFIDKTKRGIIFTALGLSTFVLNTALTGFALSKDYSIILSALWLIAGVIIVQNNVKKVPVFKASTSWLIMLSSLAFALVHTANFSEVDVSWYQKIILTIPQFFMGVAFGIVRVELSMAYSVLGHAFNNTLALL